MKPEVLAASLVGKFSVLAETIRLDVSNSMRYGRYFPKKHQLIYVRTSEILMRNPVLNYHHSAVVLGGDWDLSVFSIWDDRASNQNFLLFLDALQNGSPFEKSKIFERTSERWKKKNYLSEKDVITRYKVLSELLAIVLKRNELPPVGELGRFREFGGILIHLGRNFQPILGRAGSHRLAIAHFAGLDIIPAQIGAIHSQLVENKENLRRLKTIAEERRLC